MGNHSNASLPILVKCYAQCIYRLGYSLGPAMFSAGVGKVNFNAVRYECFQNPEAIKNVHSLTSYSRLLSQSSQVANLAII
jgi:hypothetical protein